jgi:hypothetical protein
MSLSPLIHTFHVVFGYREWFSEEEARKVIRVWNKGFHTIRIREIPLRYAEVVCTFSPTDKRNAFINHQIGYRQSSTLAIKVATKS